MRTPLKFSVHLLLGIITPAALRAQELYHLDFLPSDVGTYQVTAGNPSVQTGAGSFSNALVFNAVTSGEQILLPITVTAPRYELQFDVLPQSLANSDFAFRIFFDTPTAQALNFQGGLNSIYLFQSFPYLDVSLESFTNDSVYHLDIALDTHAAAWSVAVNGNSLFSGPLEGSALQDIRFGLMPWIIDATNAPNADVALDHVIVDAVPEPAAAGLAAAGVWLWLTLLKTRKSNRRNS